MLYEGYAPHGVPVMIETATDNPTRTVANLRTHFKKGGGNLANTGSVAFLSRRVGTFRLDPEKLAEDGLDLEELELDLIDHGLEEMGEGRGEKDERDQERQVVGDPPAPDAVHVCAFP